MPISTVTPRSTSLRHMPGDHARATMDRMLHWLRYRRHLAMIAVALIALVAGAAAVTYVRDPYTVRCYFVGLSRMPEIAPRVYVDPAMPRAKRRFLLQSLAEAQRRTTSLFGSLQANPVIIAGSTENVMHTYGSAAGATALTHLTILGSYTVLGPPGLNPDVISHELVHSELVARVGGSGFDRLPVWFDEGLAMVNDERPRYSESEYQKETNGGLSAPSFTSIASRVGFYGGSNDRNLDQERVYLNFMTAKHEVTRWYQRVGRAGLAELLSAVRAGRNFETEYTQVERRSPER